MAIDVCRTVLRVEISARLDLVNVPALLSGRPVKEIDLVVCDGLGHELPDIYLAEGTNLHDLPAANLGYFLNETVEMNTGGDVLLMGIGGPGENR